MYLHAKTLAEREQPSHKFLSAPCQLVSIRIKCVAPCLRKASVTVCIVYVVGVSLYYEASYG